MLMPSETLNTAQVLQILDRREGPVYTIPDGTRAKVEVIKSSLVEALHQVPAAATWRVTWDTETGTTVTHHTRKR